MDEAALILAAQRGDLEAFNRLVLFYQDMVYQQAYRMMGEAHAAEDATQETFITAFQKVRTYRGGSFRAWLLRIVTNKCYDELRRRQRQPTTPLQPLNSEEEEMENPSWMVDRGESLEGTIERMELARAIQECLRRLSPEFRAVVILVDMQGMDYQEASQASGVPLGTIKSRLARARASMQRCLQSFGELLPHAFRLLKEGSS